MYYDNYFVYDDIVLEDDMINYNVKSVGVIIITHSAKKHLPYCITPLTLSRLNPLVLVVNSSSNDGTVEEALKLGAEVLTIPRVDFNHGSTREKARKYINTDIVIFMTPDAYPVDETMLDNLIAPILNREASASYARQIPHDGADIFESFSRAFNYPEISHIRGIEDRRDYGIATFFSSNSCAAYLNSALDEIGGFKSVLVSEDYFAVAELMREGHKIAYVANAVVKHSHRSTLLREFRRYFDVGYTRAENSWVTCIVGHAERRGIDFCISFIKEVYGKNFKLIPYALLHLLAKWSGYRIGFMSQRLPLTLKYQKFLSSQDYYWISNDYLQKTTKGIL